MSDSLFEDPVVEEIHAIRAAMLAECGGDSHALLEQVRARQNASGRRVRFAPGEPPATTKECTEAAGNAISSGKSSPAPR